MKKTTRFTTICTMQRKYRKHTFYVDIILDNEEECYYAWIWSDRYGIKDMMFGGPVHNHRFGQPVTETAQSFIETAMDDYNFKGSADLYIEDHMEED